MLINVIKESGFLQRSSIPQVEWALSFSMVTHCSAEYLQTRHNLQTQLRCQIPQPGPAKILCYIHYEGGLLTTLDQMLYLGNGCLDLAHITVGLHSLRI